MKNKGKILGKGIDALFQDLASLEEVDVQTETVVDISLNELRPNPYQPRKTFDETSLKELASSIAHSIMQVYQYDSASWLEIQVYAAANTGTNA